MKMKIWIADLLWNALQIFAGRVHNWIFSPKRNAKIRMKNRERWWEYHCRAVGTPENSRDDMRANAWAIHFGFKVSPMEAVHRGDLKQLRAH